VNELSRRTFAESLALAAVGSALGVTPDTLRISWSLPAHSSSIAPAALARVLAQAIKAQYGARLSRENLKTISEQIEHGLERVDRLKKVPLTNADEPDFVFAAAPRARPRHG
jgi:hypothetical protein